MGRKAKEGSHRPRLKSHRLTALVGVAAEPVAAPLRSRNRWHASESGRPAPQASPHRGHRSARLTAVTAVTAIPATAIPATADSRCRDAGDDAATAVSLFFSFFFLASLSENKSQSNIFLSIFIPSGSGPMTPHSLHPILTILSRWVSRMVSMPRLRSLRDLLRQLSSSWRPSS